MDAAWINQYGLYDPRGDLWAAVKEGVGSNLRAFKNVAAQWHKGRLWQERQNRPKDIGLQIIEGITS